MNIYICIIIYNIYIYLLYILLLYTFIYMYTYTYNIYAVAVTSSYALEEGARQMEPCTPSPVSFLTSASKVSLSTGGA